MIIEKDFQKTIEDSFLEYASYVAIDRALPDARDMLKVGARQILYSQYKEKLTHDKPFKKAQKTVAAAMSLAYVHGDASAYGTAIRMGKPFIFRYPLEDIQGAYGNPCASDNHSASRYVEMRSSELAKVFTEDIDKNTISKWVNNYDDTEKIPTVFCSKGFYNIVNGCSGIGVTLATSIPQFNLKEVNNALIKLLRNPNIELDEIYCPPDFSCGGIIINGKEVKESILNGKGKSITIRAKIDYNKNKHMLQVLEIPAGIFTNTICSQIGQLIEDNPECGIERLIDATKENVDIRIYLTKKADYKKVEKLLYEKTSLQYHYGINMMMLDKGAIPRLFTWREALQAHIDHEKEVYRRGFEFDLAKIEHRLHIIDGLLICIANLDEVISTIKNSSSTSAASAALQRNFLLDEEQAKAVLAIKLASLAKLEVEKLEQEKINLTQEANRLKIILQNEKEFNQQLINGWEEVSKKFGDQRITIVYDDYQDEKPPEIIKNIDIYINIKDKFVVKDKGKPKIRIYKKDKVKFIMSGNTKDNFYLFTNIGKCYQTSMESFTEEAEGDIAEKMGYVEGEHTVAIYNPFQQAKVVFFVTKLGMFNKMDVEEFLKIKKSKNILGFKDEAHDEVVVVLFGNGDEEIMIGTKNSLGVHFDTKTLRLLKAGSKGVLGIKMTIDDEVASATLITPNITHIASTISSAYVKRTPVDEFPVQSRGTKGRIVHKLGDGEQLVDIIALAADDSICYSDNFGDIDVENIPETGRNNKGAKIF